MSHGINANILHGWRKARRQAVDGPPPAIVQREFVPVAVTALPEVRVSAEHIEVELRRGALTLKIAWPASAAADLTAWTRELLR
jgi:transposase